MYCLWCCRCCLLPAIALASDLECSQQLTAKRGALQVEKTGKLYSCSRFGIPQYLLLIDSSASLSLLSSPLFLSPFLHSVRLSRCFLLLCHFGFLFSHSFVHLYGLRFIPLIYTNRFLFSPVFWFICTGSNGDVKTKKKR